MPASFCTRICDQEIDAPEGVRCRVEEAQDILFLRDIRLDGAGAAAGLLQPVDQFLRRLVLRVIIDDDRRARQAQRLGNGNADAGTGAGDDGDVMGEALLLARHGRRSFRLIEMPVFDRS